MSTLRGALAERVVVADGAMGTMLQASEATVDDFDGYEGCNEILNATRPDIEPSGSASNCLRRCSCIPSSPPARSSCIIPRRNTSAYEP